jgi:hypothetical protein
MAIEDDKNFRDSVNLGAFDATGNMQGQIAAEYGGAVDIGAGGGPTGHGGFDFGLDRGPREGEVSMQGTGLPHAGQPSSIGSLVGTVLGIPANMVGGPLAGLAVKELGKYGPGMFNEITGRAGGSMLGPGGMPAPGEIAAVGRGGGGGLLGIGNDMTNADALAALYTLLMAKQKAA